MSWGLVILCLLAVYALVIVCGRLLHPSRTRDVSETTVDLDQVWTHEDQL